MSGAEIMPGVKMDAAVEGELGDRRMKTPAGATTLSL